MKKIKVILFNLDPQNGSGEKLAQLLETSGTNSFELKHEIVSESDMP